MIRTISSIDFCDGSRLAKRQKSDQPPGTPPQAPSPLLQVETPSNLQVEDDDGYRVLTALCPYFSEETLLQISQVSRLFRNIVTQQLIYNTLHKRGFVFGQDTQQSRALLSPRHLTVQLRSFSLSYLDQKKRVEDLFYMIFTPENINSTDPLLAGVKEAHLKLELDRPNPPQWLFISRKALNVQRKISWMGQTVFIKQFSSNLPLRAPTLKEAVFCMEYFRLHTGKNLFANHFIVTNNEPYFVGQDQEGTLEIRSGYNANATYGNAPVIDFNQVVTAPASNSNQGRKALLF